MGHVTISHSAKIGCVVAVHRVEGEFLIVAQTYDQIGSWGWSSWRHKTLRCATLCADAIRAAELALSQPLIYHARVDIEARAEYDRVLKAYHSAIQAESDRPLRDKKAADLYASILPVEKPWW